MTHSLLAHRAYAWFLYFCEQERVKVIKMKNNFVKTICVFLVSMLIIGTMGFAVNAAEMESGKSGYGNVTEGFVYFNPGDVFAESEKLGFHFWHLSTVPNEDFGEFFAL
jgi:hypothetical protein